MDYSLWDCKELGRTERAHADHRCLLFFLIPQTLFSLCNFLVVSYSFLVFTSIQFKMLIFFEACFLRHFLIYTLSLVIFKSILSITTLSKQTHKYV